MQNNGLTLTIVTEAESLNFGEGLGNVTTLKKLTRENGAYTYISRQALCYNLKKCMKIQNTPLEQDGVIQYSPEATIEDYPEIDLFGYMITKPEIRKRAAVVRVSNGIALEPFAGNVDFLNNLNHLERYNNTHNEQLKGGSIANIEQHRSYYVYTITIDLDQVGIDTSTDTEIDNIEKANRVIQLLNAIKFLNRDIKGRLENLNPIFVIGGVYPLKNPFFLNRITLKNGSIDTKLLNSVLNMDNRIKDNTHIACLDGKFANTDTIHTDLNTIEMSDLFANVEAKVKEVYGV